MMISVNERVQEIGIPLSIGTEKGEVRRMFVYEAFIPGIVGGGVGALSRLAGIEYGPHRCAESRVRNLRGMAIRVYSLEPDNLST